MAGQFEIVRYIRAFDKDNFAGTIREIRQKLKATSEHGIPVLVRRVQGNNNIPWFDIVWHIDQTTWVRTRFRRDDIYVQGFLTSGGGNWFEMGRNATHSRPADPHLIDNNSVFLGFAHNYGNMLTAAGYKGSPDLTAITLNFEQFEEAVRSVAHGGTEQQRAKFMVTMAVMFSESIRFNPIYDYMIRFYNDKGQFCAKLPGWIDKLVKNWVTYSDLLRGVTHWTPLKLRIDVCERQDVWVEKTLDIDRIDQLVPHLGILRRTN